jgi:hypothetical protein
MKRAERAMIPLQQKYRKAIELAEQAEIDSAPQEHEGRLYFIGTVRAPADVSNIWEAIRAQPEWDAEVIADIRSTDDLRRAFASGARTGSEGPVLRAACRVDRAAERPRKNGNSRLRLLQGPVRCPSALVPKG